MDQNPASEHRPGRFLIDKPMKRLLIACLFALPLIGCGLAEDEQDDKNKRIYITLSLIHI